MVGYNLPYKSQMDFMGQDFEADKPGVNAELTVMMADLQLKSSWTKLKTIPREIFILTNQAEISRVNKN